MIRKEKPKFFALVNDFNTGKMKTVNVIDRLLAGVLDSKGKINTREFTNFNAKEGKYVSVSNRAEFNEHFIHKARYIFSGDCYYEFLKVDWPYKSSGLIEDNRPVKLDVWKQIEPNMHIITDLLWNYMGDLI